MKIIKFISISRLGVLLYSIISISIQAQTLDEENAKVMSRMDTESFKGKIVLNKAVAFEHQLEPFRKREKVKDGSSLVHLSSGEICQLFDLAERGDMEERRKPQAIEKIQNRTRNEVTGSNVIPIGIINLDAILLTEEQVQENIKARSDGKRADASAYENLELIAAGLLQDEIFQGEVEFQLSEDLLYSNNKNEIRAVSIDFLDGKGWQTHSLKDGLIRHRFGAVGEVAIYIRLETERGTYITSNTLKINMLDRIKADEVGIVTAEGKENGRISERVMTAEFAIYNGCDGVLNKPIIIAEGFDRNGKNNIDDMKARFFPYLSILRENGYDFVFVNYDQGTFSIQYNAGAVKNVINEIKNRIQPTDSIIFIGQSMSGLIGRWALREMENAGQPHKVKLFIGFDAGQQGSYTPPGLVALARALPTLAGWAKPIIEFLSPALQAIESPASRQLLTHHSMFGPHPDFQILKQNLNNMGNGGYPALSRNIAIINGSLTGARQKKDGSTTQDIVPGEKLLDIRVITFLTGGGNIRAWSNKPGENTQVFQAFSSTLFNPFYFQSSSVNLPYSYDRLPGGFVKEGIDIKFPGLQVSTIPKFTHMPVFSSIDYRGPLNSDADRTFSVAGNITNISNQVINQSLTPFKAIYGNGLNNSRHTFPVDIQEAWNTLAMQELGLNSNTVVLASCVLPAPPAVTKAFKPDRGAWQYPALPTGICAYIYGSWSQGSNSILLAIHGLSPDYESFIEITGPNDYKKILHPGTGGRVRWNYSDAGVGLFNIASVRQYTGGRGKVSTSRTLQISSNCRVGINACPTDENQGELIMTLTDTNEPSYAVKINGVWIAVLDDGTFVSRERLIANGLTTDGVNCYSATDPQGSAPASTCSDLGNLSYQRWDNIGGGTSIDDLINTTNAFQNSPTFSENLNIFEAPTDISDNYGSRMRGYVCPPTTGQYTFWLAGDDNAELWLSSDQNPDNSELIAYHSAWTPSREWSWFSTQRSFPITLQANQKYYIEARMKEGSGGDNLAVGWQLPNGALERPIPGNRLAPFNTVVNPPSCDFNISAGNTNANPSANQGLQVNYSCSGANCNGVSYSWSGNGISGSASPLSITAPGSAGTYTYTVTASKSGCSNKTATTTVTVGGGGSYNQCKEAESSTGNGAITGDPNASNGQTRGEEANNNHYVDYALTGVPSAGTYALTLRYYSSSAPTVGIQINGGSTQTVNLPNSGSWNIGWTEQTINVNLAAGNNTIRILGTGGGSCRQDKICVTGGGGNCTAPAPPTLSASPSTINAGSSSTLSANGCSGTVTWSNGLGTGASKTVSPSATTTYTATCSANGCTSSTASVTVTVNGYSGSYSQCKEAESSTGNGAITGDPNASNGQTRGEEANNNHYVDYALTGVPSAGTYYVKLRYYSSSAPTVTVQVNGGASQTVNLPNSGSWNIVWTEYNIAVNLAASNNTVRIQGAGGGSCRQDRICVSNDPNARIGIVKNYTAESVLQEASELTVSPNPNTGNFEVAFYLEKDKKATLSVVDAKGINWLERNMTGTGNHKEKVVLSGHNSGTFIVLLRKENGAESKKVIVIK